MAEQVQPQPSSTPLAVLAPLTLAPMAAPDESYPTFRADRLGELAAFVVDHMTAHSMSEEAISIEPPLADVHPGRRLLAAGEPICRVIGDASDPRPLTAVVLGLLRSEVAGRRLSRRR